MGKMVESPRYNILSMRVSDEDLADIKRILAQQYGAMKPPLNISGYLRMALYSQLARDQSALASAGVADV